MHAISMLSRGYISPIQIIERIVGTVPLSPSEAQNLLVKSLELPLPTSLQDAKGIFQSDVIIRTALVAAIADLRANPWLLDYVFASLPKDDLTLKDYGEREVDQAKKWFLQTNIPVFMNVRVPDSGKPPCITIALANSDESENTLGDVHYHPREDLETPWLALTKLFDPISYNAATGIMVIPDEIVASLVLAKDMVIIDRYGKGYVVIEVLADNTVSILPGTVADFHNATIKPSKPSYVAALEGAKFKETYTIGCHAINEPVHLTYLHSIVVFILLRYRQALLECRGFERSYISSSDFHKNEHFDMEQVFSRYIAISGYVYQSWPKAISARVTSFANQLAIIDGGHAPVEAADQTIDDLTWVGDQDALNTDFSKLK